MRQTFIKNPLKKTIRFDITNSHRNIQPGNTGYFTFTEKSTLLKIINHIQINDHRKKESFIVLDPFGALNY